MDDVPNPYGNGTERVARRMNIDAVQWMWHHNQITEQQKQAAEKYQMAYLAYAAQLGQAIDYAKERVDTSGVMEAVTATQLDAAQIVKEATKLLGHRRAYRMQMVAGEGWFVKDFALKVHGLTSRRSVDKMSGEFKDDLAELALLWGFDAKKKAQRIRTWQAA